MNRLEAAVGRDISRAARRSRRARRVEVCCGSSRRTGRRSRRGAGCLIVVVVRGRVAVLLQRRRLATQIRNDKQGESQAHSNTQLDFQQEKQTPCLETGLLRAFRIEMSSNSANRLTTNRLAYRRLSGNMPQRAFRAIELFEGAAQNIQHE